MTKYNLSLLSYWYWVCSNNLCFKRDYSYILLIITINIVKILLLNSTSFFVSAAYDNIQDKGLFSLTHTKKGNTHALAGICVKSN